jgi:Flp pilus assembly protein TadG
MNCSRRTDARRAVAALEFALVLPVLALLLLAGVDLSLWFINKFRLDNAAQSLGNIVAAAQTLPLSAFPASFCAGTSTSLNYFAIAYTMSSPLGVCGTQGATIISGITNNGTTTTISWQERNGNAVAYPSLFGTPGKTLKLPAGYSVPSGHSIVATELYTDLSPWKFSLALMPGPGPTSLYSYAIYEPRSGTLATPH